jgi:cardiolipin synthase
MHTLLHQLLTTSLGNTPVFFIILFADILALVSAPSVIIQRRSQPLSALSWVFAIFALPYVGVIFWWLLGHTKVKHAKEKRQKSTAQLSQNPHAQTDPENEREARKVFKGLIPAKPVIDSLSEGIFPPTTSNTIRPLIGGAEAFDVMARALESANQEINLLFYIWQHDETGFEFRDIVAEKAREGLTVRLLVDDVGSPRFTRKFVKPLKEAGVQVDRFLPATFRPWAPTFNFRNHRKLIVIDREIAFSGGMNIGDDYRSRFHDMQFGIRGPAVSHMNDIFRDDWFFTTDEDPIAEPLEHPNHEHAEIFEHEDAATNVPSTVVASAPAGQDNHMHDTIFLTLSKAEKRLWLTTPYFVPGTAILTALRSAARRGVDVRLLLPHRNDVPIVGLASRSYYQSLLRAGVKIFEYTDKALHAKAMVIDDELTFLGSPNIDIRSLEIDYEIGCLMHSNKLNRRLANVFETDLETSERIDQERVKSTPFRQMMAESVANLLSPLL